MATTHSVRPSKGGVASGLRTWVAGRPLAVFFTLAFGLSWSFMVADALGARGLIPFRLTLSGPGLALVLLMSYGPTIAALLVAGATEGRAGVMALLGAVVRWRVSLRWYALALFGPAALFFIAGRLAELMGQGAYPLPPGGWAVILSGVLGSLVHGIVNGEEIGWRGYALPRLLERHSALTASLILGLIWSVFHIPIMFATNSVAGGQSLESALPFSLGTLALSVLMTWIYRSTGGSVLIIILLHGAFNTWPGLIGDGGGGIALGLQVLAALVVLVKFGRDLSSPAPRNV